MILYRCLNCVLFHPNFFEDQESPVAKYRRIPVGGFRSADRAECRNKCSRGHRDRDIILRRWVFHSDPLPIQLVGTEISGIKKRGEKARDIPAWEGRNT